MGLVKRRRPLGYLRGLIIAFGIGAACSAFAATPADQTNAVWVLVEHGGIIKVAQSDATLLQVIDDLPAEPVSLAVDNTRFTLWITTANRQLHAYNFNGVRQFSVPVLPNTTTIDADELDDVDIDEDLDEAVMAVDPVDGSVWIGDKKLLFKFAADGTFINTWSQAKKVRSLSFDEARRILWVVTKKGISAVDIQGTLQTYIDMGALDEARDVDVDPASGSLWVGIKKELRRYSSTGAVELKVPVEHISYLAAAGNGNVWLNTKKELKLYSSAGVLLKTVDPFAGNGHLEDIAANHDDFSAWLLDEKAVVHVDVDGLQKGIFSWTGEELEQIALSFDRTAPQVSIVSPADNSVAIARQIFQLQFSDVGSGVDPASTRFTVNGSVAAFDCTTTADTASCTPQVGFTTSPINVSVTVKDYAGNVSGPAAVTLTLDSDGDGYSDDVDAFPNDPTEWADLDGDGIGDNSDPDKDGDGHNNDVDAFPDDPAEWLDTDDDGIGDNSDPDRDGDGHNNDVDAFPLDATEWADLDGDGIGDNSDPDRDGDGYANAQDVFPNNPAEWADLDGDGIGDNSDPDRDGDTYNNDVDVFPNDPTEWADLDGDGVGDNSDPDRDNDGYLNVNDLFPDNPTEWADLDGDGIGDNSDPDKDGDGVANADDVFPSDPTRWKLPVISITEPATLITVGASPIQVAGTIDDPTAAVTVNGVPVTVTSGGFMIDVALTEGFNSIVARATDAKGSEATSSIVVTLDATPPHVTVQAPEDGTTVSTPAITVTGLVNDIVRGTVAADQAQVTVNGIAATVSNRSYIAENVPLTAGINTITVTGSDKVGNTESKTISVTYTPLSGAKIELVSGQGQSANILNPVAQPLVVRTLNASGLPVAGAEVVFRIIQGDGTVGQTASSLDRAVKVSTDVNGQASALFSLGSRAGQGNHRVSAKSIGYAGEIIFHASANPNPGNKISVIAGNNQRGVIHSPLPAPFVAAVSDQGGNLVANAPVEFRVTQGSGKFQNGELTYVTTTDSDGRASAVLTTGSEVGLDRQGAIAKLVGTDASAGFTASALEPGDPGQTKIVGVVLDNLDVPVPGVTLRVEGTTREAVTNAEGQFTVDQVPVGPVRLLVDGNTSSRAGDWPTLSYDVVTVAGAENPLPNPIYILPLNTANAVTVGDQDVILRLNEVPGFELEVKAGSVTFPDGSKTGKLSVTSVNANKVPMPPPNGMQPQFIVTIQPTGAKFDPPARLTLPNVDGNPPGAEVEMFSYDHDLEEFVTIGWGTVSEDGATVKSNIGIGVIKAGWHCGAQPTGSGCCSNSGGGGGGCPECQKRENDECNAKCVPNDSGSCDGDTSNPCTTGVCQGGACQNENVADGTGCSEGHEDQDCKIWQCKNGACDGSQNIPDGVSCNSNDGNECTTGKCENGACQPVPLDFPAVCDPGDNNPCTTGKCEGSSCVPENVGDGSFCDLGNDNPCQTGSCQGGSCTPNNVANGTSCNAGTPDACTEGGQCQDGACVAGQQISCDDFNECTEDTCGPDGCVNTPLTNGGCCSGFAFDPATQGCCSGTIYQLGSICCYETSQCQ